MKKGIIYFLLVFFVQSTMVGQEFLNVSEAFKRSYSYENEGKYAEAAKELVKIYNADSYDINLRLGWLNYKSGSLVESMNYYQKAIALKPYAIEPKFGFVSPAAAAGNWSQVEEQYKKILEIDPMNTVANYYLGLIYYNRAQFDIAIKYFEKVANLYPFDYDSVIMYAWTNFKMQNLREAKVLFQKALLIRPNDSSALEGLGLIK
ncbi:MAG TPA: tetratricopeptide repeat protein [Bacteroidales bacterium]